MSTSHIDRHLLFGFLALQNNFLSREDLIAAVSAWLVDKSRPLSEILRARNLVTDKELALLETLHAHHLERHNHDAQQSLAALPTEICVRQQLQQLADPELTTSLNRATSLDETTAAQVVPSSPVALPQTGVSRYHIVRPHAKGGLGQVYVATDMELNRDVALKEIQPHRADEPDSRNRFVLEAEITGGLEHPGIVPVYGLGQYADGRPYYAMRFIRGGSLREAVERFHNDSLAADAHASRDFRNLLSRFIAVCNAVEYAHSRGVLHRDLKPGNIMLGKYGETLVVDWGLARAKGRADRPANSDEQTLKPRSGSGSAETLMGSAIGTPNYMSPEQAAGDLDKLGPASDVYSLGATLYSLLVGQAPFHKDDVHTALRKVCGGNFPPPRAIQSLVPKPLEAICLKAMALAPGDRYGSAAALAADLERWLADESVTAHADSLSETLWRWSRRHRALMQSAAVALVLVFAVSITALWLINGARRGEALAKRQSQTLYRAAQGYLDRWLPAINDVLQFAPGGADLRERMLAAAATDYERLADFQTADAELELERGRTMLRLGEARRGLGKLTAADEAFESADKHFGGLGRTYPSLADAARVEQGRARNRRGSILEANDNPEALSTWRSTIRLLEPKCSSAESDFDRRLVLASAHISVAEWLARGGQSESAQAETDAALGALSPPGAAGAGAGASEPSLKSYHWLRARLTGLRLQARLLSAAGKWPEARQVLDDVIRENLAARSSETVGPAQLMTEAEVEIELAGVLRHLGSYVQELEAYSVTAPVFRRLIDIAPDNPDFREGLILTLLDRAQLLLDMSRIPESEIDVEEAFAALARLTAQHPRVAQYQLELAAALELSGRKLHLKGDYSAASDNLRKAIELFDNLASSRPDVPDYRERAAVTRAQLARAYAAMEEAAQAETQFDSAFTQLTELQSIAPLHPQLATETAWVLAQRGAWRWDRRQDDRARDDLRHSIERWTEIVTTWPSPAHDRTLAESLANCPADDLRDPDRAVLHARRAAQASGDDPLAQTTLAATLLRAGLPREALDAIESARFNSGPLAKDCFLRAMALQALHDPIAAQHWFDRGAVIQCQQPGDEPQRRLAIEAAALLNVQPPAAKSPSR
jgi:eukaryotic-like serine/threonine-protein kinase